MSKIQIKIKQRTQNKFKISKLRTKENVRKYIRQNYNSFYTKYIIEEYFDMAGPTMRLKKFFIPDWYLHDIFHT